ncbi:MAG: hypothetical protein R3C99_05595 [Pirellulaceae bacterium]
MLPSAGSDRAFVRSDTLKQPGRGRRYAWLVACLGLLAIGADRRETPPRDLGALSELQPYIGQWRGVGQVRRGSSQGAWTEKADWVWKFNNDSARFVFHSPDAKYFTSAELTTAATANSTSKDNVAFALKATDEDGRAARYEGHVEDDRLVLLADTKREDGEAENSGASWPARITIRQVAGGDRMLMLYERQIEGSDRFVRMSEVGYTRVGSQFGQGSTMIECVVTGGKGTIPVTHNGKTYYVCCSGCRDLFNEDPESVLAEYAERKAKEREEAKQ